MEPVTNKIAELFKELYGDEKKIVVLNTTNGVVSIGFGEKGSEGGKMIDRSNLPIDLTAEYSADLWLKSSDFRRALAKGWLKPITPEEAEGLLRADQQRKETLARLASKDRASYGEPDAKINYIDSENPMENPMVIDEATATMVPQASSEEAQRYAEYEAQFAKAPAPTEHPGVNVIGENVSSRALALVEGANKGRLTPLEALTQLDEGSKLFTRDDFRHIVAHITLESVRDLAQSYLDAPKRGRKPR